MIYVYAIVAGPVKAQLEGIDGAAIGWVIANGLAAAVSEVPATDFEEQPLNANVHDMSWLGPRAIAHQDVNARLFELADAIVPLAFGTVFRDDSGVRQLLTTESAALASRLDTVRGSAEWVLTLHMLREPNAEEIAAASPRVQTLRSEIAASSPGRAHLMRQRLQALERDESRRIRSEAATRLLDAVRDVAVDVFREPLPTEEAVEKPLVRASVLVRRDEETSLKFMEEIERLRRQWPEPIYRLALTGPWPPYRFGGL